MTRDGIFDLVTKAIFAIKKIAPFDIHEQTEISSLGLDSLHEVELLMLVEEKIRVSVDGSDFNRCKTVGEFVDRIASQQA